MDRSKVATILTMLVILLAITAISGCTGNMSVSPTPAPTATPAATTLPAVTPAATAVPTPAATPAATPEATVTPTVLPTGLKYYPTMGPWTPGDDTFIPTPTPYAAYNLSMPWIDQKVQVPEPTVLKVTGKVASEKGYTMTALKGLPGGHLTASATTSGGGTLTLTGDGVLLNYLLDQAGPTSDATSVVFKSVDGYKTKPVLLSDIRAHPESIIAFLDESDGGPLRNLIPGQASSRWCKNLAEIIVQ